MFVKDTIQLGWQAAVLIIVRCRARELCDLNAHPPGYLLRFLVFHCSLRLSCLLNGVVSCTFRYQSCCSM